MGDVAVIVPTLRRPDSLERALRSLFAQTGVEGRLTAIVVADNDPQGSAAEVVERLRRAAPAPRRSRLRCARWRWRCPDRRRCTW